MKNETVRKIKQTNTSREIVFVYYACILFSFIYNNLRDKALQSGMSQMQIFTFTFFPPIKLHL